MANVGDKATFIKNGQLVVTCAPINCVEQNNQTTEAEFSECLKDEILKIADLNFVQKCAEENSKIEFKDLFSRPSEKRKDAAYN